MMRGKLLKRSNILHTWKTRTFELDTGLLVRTLRYYDSHGKIKGELVLNGKRCVIQLLDESTSGKPHCFALSAGGRTLIMSAGSDSAMRKWIDFMERSGASLVGVEDVEQQELWRSVMEAEERMKSTELREHAKSKHEHKNGKSEEDYFPESLSPSRTTTEETRCSSSGFSESSNVLDATTDVYDSEGEKLDDPIVGESGVGYSRSNSDPAYSGILGSSLHSRQYTYSGSSPGNMNFLGSFQGRQLAYSASSNEDTESVLATQMDALAEEVQQRMFDMGMYKECLPSSSALSQCAIFLSEDWATCDKLIVFVGNSHGGGGVGVPPGIWSRSGCASLGLENGSMVAYLEKSQAGGYGSIILDPCTHSNIVEIDGVMQKVYVKGSETAEKHIAYVWDKFIAHANADNVFVIAYGLGGECFKEFLESHTRLLFSSKIPCLHAVALIESSHRYDGITQESVKRFLRQRSINWQESNYKMGTVIAENEDLMGCVCLSGGKQDNAGTSSNPAWMIPAVKDAVFRYLDFCLDVDDYGHSGGHFTDRFAKMESQTSW